MYEASVEIDRIFSKKKQRYETWIQSPIEYESKSRNEITVYVTISRYVHSNNRK